MKKTLIAGLIILCFIGVIFFAKKSQPKSSKLSVVASFYPLADFAQQVGGDFVEVKNLTPAGAEPHDFEPTPQDLVAIQKAHVFIYNGASLEMWLDKVLPDIQNKEVIVKASDGITLHQQDPHIWMDPILASQEVENIKNGLIKADPAHTSAYEANAKKFQQKLADLDQSFQKGLSKCDRHQIVTSHNAFQYLAQRYHLDVLAISGLSPDSEPSAQKMAEVVQFTQKNNVRYIFFETLVSPKLAETIAKETGAQTIVFNPLEGLTSDEVAQGKNYLSVQQHNLESLKIALGCH